MAVLVGVLAVVVCLAGSWWYFESLTRMAAARVVRTNVPSAVLADMFVATDASGWLVLQQGSVMVATPQAALVSHRLFMEVDSRVDGSGCRMVTISPDSKSLGYFFQLVRAVTLARRMDAFVAACRRHDPVCVVSRETRPRVCPI